MADPAGISSRCIASLLNATFIRITILKTVTADTMWRRVQHQISKASESVRGASCCSKILMHVSAHLMSGVPLTLETGTVACPMTCIRVVYAVVRSGFLALFWQERRRNKSSSRMYDGMGNRRLQFYQVPEWKTIVWGCLEHFLWTFIFMTIYYTYFHYIFSGSDFRWFSDWDACYDHSSWTK